MCEGTNRYCSAVISIVRVTSAAGCAAAVPVTANATAKTNTMWVGQRPAVDGADVSLPVP